MVVMIMERVTVGLRGELTHWLLEIKTGVYIGDVNAMVRDRLWDRCVQKRGAGSVFQAWNTNTAQGFAMRIAGENDRQIKDWEGVQLILEAKDSLTDVQKRRILSER